MDFAKLDTQKASQEPQPMEVLHPVTGEPLMTDGENSVPVTIMLIGKDSKEYQQKVQKLATRRANKMLSERSVTPRINAEDSTDDALDLLTFATKGWNGIVENGREIPFSAENVRDFYVRMPWVREQVATFIDNRANFLGNSLKTS